MTRDMAASDLELAQRTVAELAGAGCLEAPGMHWAVAVSRGGGVRPTLWVATNDGGCYVPMGVYLLKSMPIAAGFDADFDARWLGWAHPAETAVRAAEARGETVSAVATTWGIPSEMLSESRIEVATGVTDAGPDSPAAELTRARSHRLQTVDAALYADLERVGEPAVSDYCRELTRRVAFGGGDDLSPVAQSIARGLVAQRWPSAEEWEALEDEYLTANLRPGTQRPGVAGVENPQQQQFYQAAFIAARRLETLLCWNRPRAQRADIVYAAWMAGVRAAFNLATLYRTSGPPACS